VQRALRWIVTLEVGPDRGVPVKFTSFHSAYGKPKRSELGIPTRWVDNKLVWAKSASAEMVVKLAPTCVLNSRDRASEPGDRDEGGLWLSAHRSTLAAKTIFYWMCGGHNSQSSDMLQTKNQNYVMHRRWKSHWKNSRFSTQLIQRGLGALGNGRNHQCDHKAGTNQSQGVR